MGPISIGPQSQSLGTGIIPPPALPQEETHLGEQTSLDCRTSRHTAEASEFPIIGMPESVHAWPVRKSFQVLICDSDGLRSATGTVSHAGGSPHLAAKLHASNLQLARPPQISRLDQAASAVDSIGKHWAPGRLNSSQR